MLTKSYSPERGVGTGSITLYSGEIGNEMLITQLDQKRLESWKEVGTL